MADTPISAWRGEDLLRWAEHVRSLGKTLEFLCWTKDESARDHLEREGACLGAIIAEYAEAINNTLDQCHHVITKYFEERTKGTQE
jgi:hypothetical protein